MALGATIFSLPTALFGTFYLSTLHGLSSGQSLVLYACLGATCLMATMLTNGLSQN